MPDFSLEQRYPAQLLIAGVDEAGRGPWAGPVIAAAVVFPTVLRLLPPQGGGREGGIIRKDIATFRPHPNPPPEGEGIVAPCEQAVSWIKNLNDSKKLKPARREQLYATIMEHADVGIGEASVAEIDTLNIWGATSLAMRRALDALPRPADAALIDGNLIPKALPCPASAVIKGDGISYSIAAASIIAKVTRDRIMQSLAREYPHYGFERHAGYGTKFHLDAIRTHGPCPAHRTRWPLHKVIKSAA